MGCLHLQEWYILGVGEGVLFREVSSIQGSGIEGFHLCVHLRYFALYIQVCCCINSSVCVCGIEYVVCEAVMNCTGL